MPKLSVVIPTYNRAALLPAAVESARRAGSDLEIMVVDDASTDDTREVCRRLAGIRYIRSSRNAGLAAARNTGILASSAELVAFLDDDDLRLPGSLDSQITALKAAPGAAFCYGRVLVADALRHLPTGEVLPRRCPTGDIFWDLLEQNFVPIVSVVAYRRSLIECNLFTAGLRGVEDWYLCLRMAEVWPVAALEEPVAIYRKANPHSGQMCSDSVSICRQMLLVQEMALRLPRAAAASRTKRRRTRLNLVKLVYNALVEEASAAFAEGDSGAARAKSREALRLRPFRARTDLSLLRLLSSA